MSPIFTLTHLLVSIETIVFVYLSFLTGTLALERLRGIAPSRLSFALYRLLAGFGTWGLLGLLLGLFGLFNQAVLVTIAVAIGIASHDQIRAHTHCLGDYLAKPRRIIAAITHSYRKQTFLKALASIWILANALFAFLPITGHDALDYHLPIMEDIRVHRALTFIPTQRGMEPFAYLPILGEIFNAIPSTLFNNTTDPYVFQLIQYGLLIILVALLYDFAKRHVKHRWLALVLVLLVLSLMDFQREALHAGYVDILAYTFSIASLLLMFDASKLIKDAAGRNRPIPFFALSAAFLGIALGIKYTALFFVPMHAVVFALGTMRARLPLARTMRIVGRYALIAFLIGGFWYIRNTIEFGNPVYPMFSDSVFTKEVNWFIVERNPANLLLAPYLIFGEWLFLENGTSSRLIVLAYFILLYGLFAWMALSRTRPSFASIAFSLAVLLYFAQLFFTSHQIRFLLPGMILLPVALVFLFDQLYERLQSALSAARYRSLMKLTAAGLMIVFTLVFLANFRYFKIKNGYLIGLYDRETYIKEIGGQ